MPEHVLNVMYRPTGLDQARAHANGRQIREQAITGYNTYVTTHMFVEKKPNAWGQYDTLGNVSASVWRRRGVSSRPAERPTRHGSIQLLRPRADDRVQER